jgi:transcriptional regulator with XRE-family HTH domain
MKSDCGAILTEWRARRRLSQLDLALATKVSQKHLSFVELGRARPSRDMILRLAVGLDLPLRARNDLLLSAGYAPIYPERPLDLTEMQGVRAALEMMLAHHEPYPAFVMDASWNIIMINQAGSRLIASCGVDQVALRTTSASVVNFMQLMFSKKGLRPCILNWHETCAALLGRLRKEATANPGSPSSKLLTEFEKAFVRQSRRELSDKERPPEPVVALQLLVSGARLKLFSTFTTFGLPQDITLQELRIDMAFPADQSTRQFFLNAAKRNVHC